ncbi:hypothetical protein [Rheinheimera sp. MM224]|uniref:HvfA family oxazolone/thioamide-modified RiPP metallophore n=1 Tax=Rheinheimera sp. MM224 TaxID=3019969 RepID=UPI0021F8312E|nr:hypothetical protein [Rheinheimera sp. MM224]CAI3806308.1 hypothetical protein JAMGFMIE_04138 [Rheinheimera sp. MM224]
MSTVKSLNNRALLIGVALTGLTLGQQAFAVEALPQGYQLSTFHAGVEGKCGEGKCGGTEPKTAEGKCGEGQCGDAKFNAVDTDDDARVSLAEFLVVAPKNKAVFDKKDTNKDGYIDERESYLSVKAAYNENGKALPTGLFSTEY